MDKIVVSLLMTFAIGLTAVQATQPLDQATQKPITGNQPPKNGSFQTNSSIGGRYLIHNKIINSTNQFRQHILKNGTLLKEKITILEIIDIETNVPDNEDYVASKIVYNVFLMYRTIKGVPHHKNKTHKGMLAKLNFLYKKWSNNKVLSKYFLSVMKYYSIYATSLLKSRGDIPKWVMKSYFHALIRDVAKAPHLTYRSLDTPHVNNIINGVLKKFKVHNRKSDYLKHLKIIMDQLFAQEKNSTIVKSILPNVQKAVDMYNINKKQDVKKNLFNMIIRTLSLMGYRLEYWEDIKCDKKSHSKDLTLINSYLYNNVTVFPQEEIQEPRKLSVTKPQKQLKNFDKLKYITHVITELIEREKTRSKLQHVYPQNLVDLLNANEDRSAAQNKIIELYKKYNDSSKPSFDINKVQSVENKNLVEHFENDLLDTLAHEKLQVQLDTEQKQGIKKLLDSKDLSTITVVTLHHIKQLLQELGVTWDSKVCCEYEKLCLKEAQEIRKDLNSIVTLQKFNKYKNGKLYKLKFATNMIHNRGNKAVILYKAYDEAHDISHLSERDLPKVISAKIGSYQTLLKYLAVISRLRKDKPATRPQEEKIMFNVNPQKPNTILTRQNEHDLGSLISIAEPNILVDAHFRTYIRVKDVKANLVRETEAHAAFINSGDTLPGTVQSYETRLWLEYITETKQNVKIVMRTFDNKAYAGCYNITAYPKEKYQVQGKIVPIGHSGKNCSTNKWEVKQFSVRHFDVYAPVVDLSRCVS